MGSKSSKISLKFKKKSDSSIINNLSNSSSHLSSRGRNSPSPTPENLSNGPVYKFEEGRRYINDDSILYPLPNDDEESTNLLKNFPCQCELTID